MTVEHRIPRSSNPALSGEYSNCLLACSLCNRARSHQPEDREGRRLLDPTLDPWGRHFHVSGDDLLPMTEDADATYTHNTYDLDDERKRRRRRLRRRLVEDRLQLISLLADLDGLMELAEIQRQRDLAAFGRTVSKLGRIRDGALRALSDLARYAMVPHDAPETCRCGVAERRLLPEGLAAQVIDLHLPKLGRSPR